MSDDLTAALIAGLLGGGVSGAIVGAITALVTQGRGFDHERSTRFAETRRDRYAELFAEADRAMMRAERSAKLPAIVADGKATAASAVHLAKIESAGLAEDRSRTEVAGLVAQIQLLGPSEVGSTAETLAAALQELASVATPLIALNVDLEVPDAVELAQDYAVKVAAPLARCRQARAAFLVAARQDIGSAVK